MLVSEMYTWGEKVLDEIWDKLQGRKDFHFIQHTAECWRSITLRIGGVTEKGHIHLSLSDECMPHRLKDDPTNICGDELFFRMFSRDHKRGEVLLEKIPAKDLFETVLNQMRHLEDAAVPKRDLTCAERAYAKAVTQREPKANIDDKSICMMEILHLMDGAAARGRFDMVVTYEGDQMTWHYYPLRVFADHWGVKMEYDIIEIEGKLSHRFKIDWSQ